MGNITSTDSRRSGGSNSVVLVAAAAAAPEGRPQKRIKLTKTINDVGLPKHTSISSNNTSSSSGDGANKTEDNDGDIEELTLPAECYALVLEYLDYQTVLSCALTSKVFLHDAMPLVKTLNIDTALQMNIPLTSRFRDIQHINLYSLLKGKLIDEDFGGEDGIELLSVNYDAVIQVVPFLSSFPSLSRVFLGGKKINGDVVTFCHYSDLWDEDEDPGRVHTLMDMISGSFVSAGGILKNVQVVGLRCPSSSKKIGNHTETDSGCQICKRVCRSFPLDQVVTVGNQGASDSAEGLFSSKKTHCIDVCLSRKEIESIVEERPGGKAMLQSNARLLHLLGSISSYEIRSDDGESLFIVKSVPKERKELKRVIESAQLKVKEMSSEDVTKALWQSFAKEGGRVPPKDQCYLTRSSLNNLVDEIGLPINKKEFGLEAADIRNMAQIVKGLISDVESVRSSCLVLLKNLLKGSGVWLKGISARARNIIQSVVDLGVVPPLVQLLSKDVWCQKNALYSLIAIASKGSDDNVQVLIDAGAVPKLVLLLSGESDDSVAKDSVSMLKRLANRSTAIRDVILRKGGLSSLIQLSRQKNTPGILPTVECLLFGEPVPNLDECEIGFDVFTVLLEDDSTKEIGCKVLSYICHTPSKHRKAMIEAGLFPLLLDLMNSFSPEVQEPALETIRRLLRHDGSLVEEIIESDKFPSLISSMFSPVKEVRNEVCEILSCILNGTKEQVDILVTQGCIRALCSVLDMSHPVLVINASLSLVKILKHRMTEANPEGIDILDGEIKCITNKLDDLDREIDGSANEWKELKSLVGVVREELEGSTKKADTVLDSIVEEGDEQDGGEEGEDEEHLGEVRSKLEEEEEEDEEEVVVPLCLRDDNDVGS